MADLCCNARQPQQQQQQQSTTDTESVLAANVTTTQTEHGLSPDHKEEPNPFLNPTRRLTCYEVIKIVLMSPIALVRIILLLITLLLIALWCGIFTLGASRTPGPGSEVTFSMIISPLLIISCRMFLPWDPADVFSWHPCNG